MKLRKKQKEGSEVYTDTLVDILFIVLMFFLIVSTIANPNIVKMNNPSGTKDSKAKQNIVVSVGKDQQYYIGTTKIESAIFDSMLKLEIIKYRSIVDTPSVVINADTAAFYGDVFRVMRIARKDSAKVTAMVK
jgi:biopolymer transport protein ExbD